MSIVLHEGDCREKLAALPDNSIHACVTDPPYLLDFMNQRWDSPDAAVFGVSPWEAWFSGFVAGEGCFRIQAHKDGKYYACSFTLHLRADEAPLIESLRRKLGGRVVFGDARVSRQGVKSAPDVRWLIETREGCWKLANIFDRVPLFAKKAADYKLWRRALQIWTDTPKGSRWHGARDVSEIAALHRQLQDVRRFDEAAVDVHLDPFRPPAEHFHYEWAREVYRVLRPGAHLVAFGGTRTHHRMVCAIEDAGFEIRDTIGFLWAFGSGFPKSHNLPNGLGTALKPAFEPICLARKPLDGTVADNLLKWGVGALNIDACRIGTDGGITRHTRCFGETWNWTGNKATGEVTINGGRWPANLVTDGSEEVCSLFPQQAGAQGKASGPSLRNGSDRNCMSGHFNGTNADPCFYGDSGSAARFFYTAKAGPEDRAGSKHPTVKPLSLMRWLIQLVTPPKGTVLDPFAGSGTTGAAALSIGFDAILIEREPKYCADIRARIALQESTSLIALAARPRLARPTK